MDNLIYNKIELLCSEGDEYMGCGFFDKALLKYQEALELVPEPKNDWEASTWILCAIGDVYFFKSDYKQSLNYFFEALNAPDGIDNPFIQLRLGQLFFELGNKKKAKEYLIGAYMLEGEEIFEDEQKYYELIKNNIWQN